MSDIRRPTIFTQDQTGMGCSVSFDVTQGLILIKNYHDKKTITLKQHSVVGITTVADMYRSFIDIGRYQRQQVVKIQKCEKDVRIFHIDYDDRYIFYFTPKFSLDVTYSSPDHEQYQTIRGILLPPKKVFRRLVSTAENTALWNSPISVVY